MVCPKGGIREVKQTPAVLFFLLCCGWAALAWLSTAGFAQTYTTTFKDTEDPLSEGGRWSNNGLDWTSIRKSGGTAYGTQTGTETGDRKFRDSYAILSGFPPDQEARGRAYIARPSSSCYQEVEILLRFTSSPHRTTGYECFARCVADSSSYVNISGDTLKAPIIGNVITVYINGVKKAQVTADTFKTGNPGIGMFLACDGRHGIGTNTDFGFTSFTAKGSGGSRKSRAWIGLAHRPGETSTGPVDSTASRCAIGYSIGR
jgi:hypothetical protein